MLADEADRLIGVDTHRDTHTARLVETATGRLGPGLTVTADARGYRSLLGFADGNAPGARAWAIEATGGYGAGLAQYLRQHGERIVEVDRPKRPARRSGAKSDELDAARAAREALSRKHPTEPRRRGDREAVRVLLRTREGAVKARTQAISQLKALRVCAPEELRAKLRSLSGRRLVRSCARLRVGASLPNEERMTTIALRSAARRIERLEAEIASSRRSSGPCFARSARRCCESPASASARRRSSSTPGRIRAAFARRPRSRCSAGWRRSRPPRARRSAIVSIAPAIGG